MNRAYLCLALDFGRFMWVSRRNLEGKSKFTTAVKKLHVSRKIENWKTRRFSVMQHMYPHLKVYVDSNMYDAYAHRIHLNPK